jgi:hypothetical protein
MLRTRCCDSALTRKSLGKALSFRLAALLAILLLVQLGVQAQQPPPIPPPPTAKTVPQPPAAAKQPLPVSSPEAVALDKKILDEAKNGSEIMANLTYLSDIIGPRLTGSPALRRANDWTKEKMISYGLSNVHLEAYEIPMGWERGFANARLIEPNNGRPLVMASAGWSPGTNGKIEGDVVILNARNAKDLEAYKGKLKNAVILRGAPREIRPLGETSMFPTRDFGTPGAPGTPGGQGRPGGAGAPGGQPGGQPGRRGGNFEGVAGFQREMADFLRKEGVAAMLQDAAKPHGLLNMTGGWRGLDRTGSEPLPSLFVVHEHYALLHRLASRPAPALTRIELEVQNKFIPGPVAVYNTVGEIRGSEKPDEFVIVGAHLDSWDLGQGTTDNGTGTSVVLETARILTKAGVKPKRTIRFILFTGEEQGLHGSRAYTEQHKDELPRISMCLVHDTGTGRAIGLGLQGRAPLKPLMEAELATLKEIGLKEVNLRGMGGSDHASFERAGVPGFAFQQDPAEYRFTHHSQSDTLDKARPADLTQGAQAMAVIAVRVANLPNLLSREKQ